MEVRVKSKMGALLNCYNCYNVILAEKAGQ